MAAGLTELLQDASERHLSEEQAVSAFRYAWLQSILDALAPTDWRVGSFLPEAHEKAIADYRNSDREHIDTAASRIRRITAERATSARDQHRDQAEIVQHQANLQRRHLPVRDFVRQATDVLLELKPCWAMSPLVVSQLLPANAIFDVVIFDEASQITPADAIPAILRGRQLVVAGDEHQLPPTAFFVSESPEEEDEDVMVDVPVFAGTKGFESILQRLNALFAPRMLQWHYRSRDEHLIAFSNAHIYDRALTTFPGIGGDRCLDYVEVPHQTGDEPNSPSAEVERVVELILEHARTRPDESLGVIAMGVKHSDRIEETLRQQLRDLPDLDEFFDESRDERFFVKNLERVQGDERDAIILSIGYGKNDRGQLVYRFGPLLSEGGERRLNVAVTRAKKRMIVVASFSAGDMDPERTTGEGMKLIRQYLQYVESGGTNLGDVIIEKPALNPFEIDVRDTLLRHGLKLIAQYGTSGYWIDFVVQHPTQPGRYVLAIECDGASYHASQSARDRDRLRQEQLERLNWRFHRIWSSDWFHNKDKAVERVLEAYKDAVTGAEAPPSKKPQPTTSTSPSPKQLAGAHAEPNTPATRTARQPALVPRQPIEKYPTRTLVQLARWIESDDQNRTQNEVLDEMVHHLGYRRRGHKIVETLTKAITEARRDSTPR
jgi:very-short-patch-repair endonuclease